MTSLADAYERRVGERADARRLYLGLGLFGVGVIAVVLGLVFGTTDLLARFGYGTYGARKLAGALAGLGVPAVFVGIFAILPASRRVRAAAAIGASVAVLGVAMFWSVYPADWAGYGRDLTLPVAAVYFLGTVVTLWCLFVAIATFKTRNDPGGTVSLEVTTAGETRVVEVDRSALSGLGGVGVLGDEPVGAVDTGTNRAASDGGAAETESTEGPRRPAVDRYCGNCARFDYVRATDGMRPYCEYHDEVMDDMDACESWLENRRA